jgi:LacI family transcriptional regulator
MVIVDRDLENGVDADLVRIDHELRCLSGDVRHLLELGHRRHRLYLAARLSTSVARMRLAGYHRAHARGGLSRSRTSWVMLESDFTSTKRLSTPPASLLEERARRAAIFAANDMVGIGVLRAAAERNVRVPADLSVIGFR